MSLRKYALSGIKWNGTSQFIRQAIQIVTTLVLARLLQPADFGLMGMALVIIGFLNVFKDVGTSAAIIQKQEISQHLLSSIFWFNIGIGILISGIVIVASPLLALLFNDDRLVDIIRFCVITFFSGTLLSTQQALLEKGMNFKRLALFEILSVSLGAVVGIVSAYNGGGVWSLVFQSTSASLLLCCLLWIQPSHWIPSIHFEWNDIRTIRSFISNLSGFTVVNYFLRNADSFIIGRYLGANDLGYYSMAYKVMIAPLQNLTAVISRVMFPLLSSINTDHERMKKTYSKIVLTIAFFSFPFFAWLMVVNEEFVSVIFGDRWLPVAPILFILSPVGLLQSIDSTTGSLFQAKGRTDILFRWALFTGGLAVIAFYIGAHWGLSGVAIGYVAVTVLWTYHGFAIPLRLINQNAMQFFSQFRTVTAIVVTLFVAGLVVQQIAMAMGMSTTNRFLFMTVMIVAVYTVLSITWNRRQLQDIRSAIAEKA